jgi:hypothetical protein
MIALYIVMIAVFVSYVTFIWTKYGVQESISASYYKLPDSEKALFTLFCWGFAIPAMILGNCGLMFMAGAAICFVGAAAAFRGDKMTRTVHMVSAGLGVVLSQIAMAFVFHFYWMPVVVAGIGVLLELFKTDDKIWWFEIVAFASICIGLGLII